QAEDGIRDFHVTGVQTCALPILFKYFFSLRILVLLPVISFAQTQTDTLNYIFFAKPVNLLSTSFDKHLNTYSLNTGLIFNKTFRSEERRVGKECRFRLPCHRRRQ